MLIDGLQLKADLEKNCMGAYFGGGFGGAMDQLGEMQNVSPEQLIQIALSNGYDLSNYEIPDTEEDEIELF